MRGISFVVAPIRDHAFFKQPQFQRLFGDDFLQIAGFLAKHLHLIGVAARAVSPASRFLPASRNSFDQL